VLTNAGIQSAFSRTFIDIKIITSIRGYLKLKNEPMTRWHEGDKLFYTDKDGVVHEGVMVWCRENDKLFYADEEGQVHKAPSKRWKKGGSMYHLCRLTRFRNFGKVYKWTPRKPNPVACPRCRYRFDSPYGKDET
jgi:hypothetical protein